MVRMLDRDVGKIIDLIDELGLQEQTLIIFTSDNGGHKTIHEVIAFQDMLPTFAKLAGAKPPNNLDGISVLTAFQGNQFPKERPPLYWDYGHCRGKQYAQAARLGKWKGIRSVRTGNVMELYDLETDPAEATNLAATHNEIVVRIATFMDQAVAPNPRYKIGTIYRGNQIWKRTE